MALSKNRKIALLGIACLLTTALIIIAGLWPFNFNPVNKVEWLQNGNGIRFYGQGMVVSRQSLSFGTRHLGTDSISIEIWVLPHKESTNTVASIVTLYDHDREVFMAGQWISELIIRVPVIKAERQKRHREIGIANALTKEVTHLITMISEKETTAIYIDGKLDKTVPNFSLLPKDKVLSGRLILGNSPDGTHAWNGSFFGLAVYNQALRNTEVLDHYNAWLQHILPRSQAMFRQLDPGHSGGPTKPAALYLFNERSGEVVRESSGPGDDLMIPPVFQPLRRTVLEMPDKNSFFSRSNLDDVAINIVGFIPFGFFLSAWLPMAKNLPVRKVYGITLFFGFCLSLAIELIQVYLPMRDSSLMDVISNAVGTAIGIMLLHYSISIFQHGDPKTQIHLY